MNFNEKKPFLSVLFLKLLYFKYPFFYCVRRKNKVSLRGVMDKALLTVKVFNKQISDDSGSIPDEGRHFFVIEKYLPVIFRSVFVLFILRCSV